MSSEEFRSPERDEEEPLYAALAHKTPIPLRVKSGLITSDHLQVQTAHSERAIPWSQVELLCLGIVEEPVGGVETPKSGLRTMLRKILLGDNVTDKHQGPAVRDVLLLDMYLRGEEVPLRFDSTNINYRSFLGETGYQSLVNFQRLLEEICRSAHSALLDESVAGLLRRRREQVRRYASVYDFELECQSLRKDPARLISCSYIDPSTGRIVSAKILKSEEEISSAAQDLAPPSGFSAPKTRNLNEDLPRDKKPQEGTGEKFDSQ